MQLFRKFTDLVEYTFIKIKNGYNPKRFIIFFNDIEKTYDIFLSLLTPYLDTLKGNKNVIPSVIRHYQGKSTKFKSVLDKKISNYYRYFENNNLFPSFEEMEEELENLSEKLTPEDKDIDTIYQIIGASNSLSCD